MEINFSWNSSDSYEIQSYLSDSLHSFLSPVYIINDLTLNSDYFICDSENTQVTKDLPISSLINPCNPSLISLSISPSELAVSNIKLLLNSGEEKEKRYSELKKYIDKLREKITIEKNVIEKLLMSKIKPKDKFYYVLVDKIVENVLKPNSFFKEIKDVSNNIMKMKTNKIITLYYKIYLTQGDKCISCMYKYSTLFKSNNKMILTFTEAFSNLTKYIIHCINEEIVEKIKSNEVYIKNKKEYTSTFAYIENVILMFPIIKYMNNVSHSLVFSGLEKPKKAAQTENLFLILKEIIYQFPNYDKLKESIKEDRLVQESLSMIFKRDFELYGTMHVESRDLLYDYLLYEN